MCGFHTKFAFSLFTIADLLTTANPSNEDTVFLLAVLLIAADVCRNHSFQIEFILVGVDLRSTNLSLWWIWKRTNLAASGWFCPLWENTEGIHWWPCCSLSSWYFWVFWANLIAKGCRESSCSRLVDPSTPVTATSITACLPLPKGLLSKMSVSQRNIPKWLMRQRCWCEECEDPRKDRYS